MPWLSLLPLLNAHDNYARLGPDQLISYHGSLIFDS